MKTVRVHGMTAPLRTALRSPPLARAETDEERLPVAAPKARWRGRLAHPARLALAALRLPETLANWIASFAIVAITLLTFLNAVARYIFGRPLDYALETAAFLFVYTVYLAVASAARADLHTRVTWLHDLSPRIARRVLDAATSAIGVFFAFVLFWSGLKYAGQSMDRGFETTELLFNSTAPLWVFHAAVAAGGLLLLIFHASQFALTVLGRDSRRVEAGEETKTPAWVGRL